MTDLIAVAAYGKVHGLTNEECVTLWEGARHRSGYTPPTLLEWLDAAILDIKRSRRSRR